MLIKNKLFEDVLAVAGGIFSTCLKANNKIINDVKNKFQPFDQKTNITHQEYENLLSMIADLKTKQEILSNQIEILTFKKNNQ